MHDFFAQTQARGPNQSVPTCILKFKNCDFHFIVDIYCSNRLLGEHLLTLKAMRRHLTALEAGQAVGMLQAGQVQRTVSRHFNVSQSVISRLWNRFRQTGNVSERPRSGRPRSTTARQDRYMSLMARRHRFQSAVQLNTDFHAASGVRITPQTLRQRLHAANLRAHRPAVRPILRRHRVARLNWAQNHINWQLRHWTPVLFTDESRFCVDFHDGRRRVWRMRGERYADCCVSEHDRFGGGSVMIWAGISIGGCTDLHVINGNLTGAIYRDEILHPIVRPYAGAIGNDFVLMDDNARPHRARIVTDYLATETIERMDWPSCSPDLNPIEHAWDMLQQAVSRRPVLPTNRQELTLALQQEWARLPQIAFRRLIRSMQRRCRAVIQAQGGHTPY